MNSSEIEFLAEKFPIEIIPNFSYDKVHLISGDFGPFRAGVPTEIPLWVSINLKKRGKCRIIPPSWMDIDNLTEIKKGESESKVFTEMPCDHYLVVAQLIISAAAEDIPNAQTIKTLIKDIWDLRISKLRSSITEFIKSEGTHSKLDHLSLMELNSIRPFLPHSLDQLNRLRKSALLIGQTNLSQNM